MNRPDGRIEKGQRLTTAISARAWNRAQDAADIVLGVRPGATAGESLPAERASNILFVANMSNAPAAPGDVLGIDAAASIAAIAGASLSGDDEASARTREWFRRPVLHGVIPSLSLHAERFCVCLEPIAANGVGRAAIGGAFGCRVNLTNISHRYATVKDGDRTQLQSAACGIVQIVWIVGPLETGEQKWAVGVI